MAKLTIFFIALTVIYLLFVQRLSVRLVVSNGYYITADYSLFTIVYKSGASRKRKKKRIPSLKPLSRALSSFLKAAKITVNRLNIPLTRSDPFSNALTFGGASSGVYSALGLLLSYAKDAEVSENALNEDDDHENPTILDVVIETRLYNVALSGIILLYEQLKRRITRFNVRKQNK